jgi:hypothetical protein
MGERDKKRGTVLEREGHGSNLKTGDTGLTGMKNRYERYSLTDRKAVQKWTSFSLGKI